MKTNQKLILVCMMAAMMQPVLINAQSNVAFRAAPLEGQKEKKIGWQPVKLDDKGSNVQNGVEFYSQKTDCNGSIVNLGKLVNTNNYAVKVSYQISADSPVINVRVGASATVEGSCSTTDVNLAKLAIPLPVGKTDEEKQKNKEYMHTHIVVTQM